MIGPMLKRADEVDGLEPCAKSVLTRFCLDADDQGSDSSQLSARRLATLTGFSERAVRRSIAQLHALGLILRVGESGDTTWQTIVDPKPVSPRPTTVGTALSKCKLSTAKRRRIMERDAYRCRHCGDHHRLSIDHVVPRSAGGSNDYDNLQVLCVPCNLKKGASRP